MTLLAALLVVTGVDALLRGPVVEQVRRLGVPNQLTVGALIGFGFTLASTGGARVARPDPAALVGAGVGSSSRRAASGGLLHRGLRPLRFVDFVLGTVQVITNESFDSMKNFLALS